MLTNFFGSIILRNFGKNINEIKKKFEKHRIAKQF